MMKLDKAPEWNSFSEFIFSIMIFYKFEKTLTTAQCK